MDRTRVLAISPFYRGLGYAVLEGPDRLVDWGVAHTYRDKNTTCLARVATLMVSYMPDAVVLEECAGKRCRRGLRVQELIREIRRLAERRMIAAHMSSRAAVRHTFALEDKASLRQIAVAVCCVCPELVPYVPPHRKCWMSENYRLRIFEAAAFGITYLKLRMQGLAASS